jgi:hypothetical protein
MRGLKSKLALSGRDGAVAKHGQTSESQIDKTDIIYSSPLSLPERRKGTKLRMPYIDQMVGIDENTVVIVIKAKNARGQQ